MASETVRSVLNFVWNALEPLGHPCALIGGLALAVWSHPRSTRDIDFLLGIERGNVDQVLDLLQSQGCRPKSLPAITIVGDHSFLQLLYTPPGEFYEVQFDFLLAESPFQKLALARSVEREVANLDRPLRVLKCDDLVLFKLLASRMIDRADAVILLRENRESLDTEHLRLWLKNLDLVSEFHEIWRDAFPAESLPDYC